MGIIDFTCQACYHSWRGHMSVCPKCGDCPIKAPMSMEQILDAPYNTETHKLTTVRQMAKK